MCCRLRVACRPVPLKASPWQRLGWSCIRVPLQLAGRSGQGREAVDVIRGEEEERPAHLHTRHPRTRSDPSASRIASGRHTPQSPSEEAARIDAAHRPPEWHRRSARSSGLAGWRDIPGYIDVRHAVSGEGLGGIWLASKSMRRRDAWCPSELVRACSSSFQGVAKEARRLASGRALADARREVVAARAS